MFKTISDLVTLAEQKNVRISDLMLEQESEETGQSADAVMEKMARQLDVMRAAVRRGLEGIRSHSGMTGGDAKKLSDYRLSGKSLENGLFIKAVNYAIATNEVNASMGVICATPTAGSCGVLPGVVLALGEQLKAGDEALTRALMTAGAVGYVIANNAFVSGAAGGCQAEVGSASAMAAAAAVEMAGGTPRQAAHAAAIALKNMLGLTCDPVAGLVEVPCIKRNAAGASGALTAAEMALAGIESRIPWDEVILAMYRIGLAMPSDVRETAQGGLADTPTGQWWKKQLWRVPPAEKKEG